MKSDQTGTDPTTWTDCETAYEHLDGYDGVSSVLGDGLAGVDLDDCRDPDTGAVVDWAQVIIACVNSYSALVPLRGSRLSLVTGPAVSPQCAWVPSLPSPCRKGAL